ncbi:hypothetical protein [Paenibacillus sp. GM2FR]|nr:hypothetical protein [Paenibacillus sp. GM2FR]
MHHVPEEGTDIPVNRAWAAFGGLEPISADYRACAAYGPCTKGGK